MPSVTPPEIEIDESKDFRHTADKAEQSHCHVYQGRNTKVNGKERPGIAVTTDATEDNQRFAVDHPTGSRLLLSPNGGVLLKGVGNVLIISGGEFQEISGNRHIVTGDFIIQADEIIITGNVKIKGDVTIDGDVSCNNITVDDQGQFGGNVSIGGDLGVGGDIANGGDLKTHDIDCDSCSC